ncbi:MAG TPA: methylene-tetrahydromethanopterin dehydrogenase N-terminal domain-containing protein, partial [Methylococcaceae bacterium]|nr:methylene-tetrahydromethanopterin dehydrogenase N-terminal domain-containing protein [Methylococcaceae bacterium]
MKKLLFQLDTDPHPSVFDTVVAYDGGADHVIGHGAVSPENVTPLVEGAIFTRAPKDKKNTALFIGGSDLAAGQELLRAVRKKFFADFRVSVMLDSNGSNTTAAAGVARLAGSGAIAGKKT